MDIEVIKYPPKENWKELLKRSVLDKAELDDVVSAILDDVKANGDAALRKYSEKFDGVALESFLVTKEEFLEAEELTDKTLKEAMSQAKRNLSIFHNAQVHELEQVEVVNGVTCWQRRADTSVGLYVPGGSAPLFLPF